MPGVTESRVEDAARLMDRVRDGDVSAFEALYDAYHRLVYGTALKVVGTESVAEDVVQSVFLKVWTAPDTFRGGYFAGWITRVARNRAIDVLRQMENASKLSVHVPADHDVEEAAVVQLDAERARRMMTVLSADQRSAIELAFFGGLSYPEIASSAAVPLGTIKSRIRTGLRSLRTAMLEGASV